MYQQYHQEKEEEPEQSNKPSSQPSSTGQPPNSAANGHETKLSPLPSSPASPLPNSSANGSTAPSSIVHSRVWPQPGPLPAEGSRSSAISSGDSLSSVTIGHNELAPTGLGLEERGSNSPGDFSDDLLGDGPPTAAEGSQGRELAEFGPMQLARAHWIQLHKTNMQLPVLRRMFLQLLGQHARLCALWPFARRFDGATARLEQMAQSNSFRHFCQSYQATLTMLMDNLEDEPALCRLLQELGSNHFFYDCIESHIRLMRDEFFRSMVDCLEGSTEELDEELAEDWEKLWAKLESNMGFGLKVQRHNYLAHCMTGKEMVVVREQWQRLKKADSSTTDGRIGKLAERIGTKGAESFLVALATIGLLSDGAELRALFLHACRDLLWAIDKAIILWEPGSGFLRLCAEIDGKCESASELIRRVGAPLVRRSFIEAFSVELTTIVPAAGQQQQGTGPEGKENGGAIMHSWTKVYRVAEQTLIAAQMDPSVRK